jgi:hypothetical protein
MILNLGVVRFGVGQTTTGRRPVDNRRAASSVRAATTFVPLDPR